MILFHLLTLAYVGLGAGHFLGPRAHHTRDPAVASRSQETPCFGYLLAYPAGNVNATLVTEYAANGVLTGFPDLQIVNRRQNGARLSLFGVFDNGTLVDEYGHGCSWTWPNFVLICNVAPGQAEAFFSLSTVGKTKSVLAYSTQNSFWVCWDPNNSNAPTFFLKNPGEGCTSVYFTLPPVSCVL